MERGVVKWQLYILGDIHAGHKNICKFRTQFTSEDEHYEFLKENINYTPINVEEIRNRLTVAAMSELTEVPQEMKLYD